MAERYAAARAANARAMPPAMRVQRSTLTQSTCSGTSVGWW